MILLTTYYQDKNAFRREELLEVLKKNVENPVFSKVVVFNEGGDLGAVASEKLITVEMSQRPLFDDFFNYVRSFSIQDDISIIANTDIYFDETISLAQKFLQENDCWALSRWDIDTGKPLLYNHNDSQDAWVFKGKPKESLQANFPLGVVRCDNKFMYLLQEAGYKVLNPAFSVKAYHLHKGQRAKVYTEADNIYNIQEPFAYKWPHNLKNGVAAFWHNTFSNPKLGTYQYDCKKINAWLLIRLLRKMYEVLSNKPFKRFGYDD